MLSLSDLLYGIRLTGTAGDMGVEPASITQDSRYAEPGCLFIAIKGTVSDGHQYIQKALDQGAVAILCEQMPDHLAEDITYVQVADAAEALGVMAHTFYGKPSHKIRLVGVTGTNGKTTVATLLYQLFIGLAYKVGLLSTVENRIGELVVPATHTTPDPVALNSLMARMVAAGCSHVFMEVSSHAIVQRRIAGLRFEGALFTNITHDHLDFHKTFDNYIAAKKRLFDDLPPEAFALTNADEKRGAVMVQNTLARIRTYALQNLATYKGRLISTSVQGNELEIDGQHVWLSLPGNFNAANCMAVYGAARELGEPEDEVLRILSALPGAPGRFETIRGPRSLLAVVDYAHTPDALKNVLHTIQGLRQGNERIITVVGCGGDRDTTKRPDMGDIAAKLSDKVVLTSDNPRTEDPEAILDQMAAGVPISARRKVSREVDRRKAIALAIEMADPGDIILIAGKGHETYQDIAGLKHPFDDREVVKQIFQTGRSD